MNTRISRILSYLPASVAGLLLIAMIWNLIHLGATAWSARAVARHIQAMQNLASSDAEQKEASSNPATNPDRSGRGGRSAPNPSGQGGLGEYEQILKRGLFVKIREQPMPVCTGIIGDTAILNNNMVRVGEQAGEWKLVEIGQAMVVLEKDGNRRNVFLFSESSPAVRSEGASPGGSSGARPSRPPTPPPPGTDGREGQVSSSPPRGALPTPPATESTVGGMSAPRRDSQGPARGGERSDLSSRPRGAGGVSLPPGFDPEAFRNMSREERAKFVEEMRRKSSGEGAGQ